MKRLLIIALTGLCLCAPANYVSVGYARSNSLCAGRNR
jgi:hypothetical protein